MGGLLDDQRWYGPRYAESVGDDLFLIAGRILRDFVHDRDSVAPVTNEATRLPRNASFIIALIGNTLDIQVHLTTDKVVPTGTLDRVRARAIEITQRYNWTGKKNKHDTRYRVVCSVKPTKTSLHRLIHGALSG